MSNHKEDRGEPTGTVNVMQGEFSTSSSDTCSMNTVLGSCVSVCLHDPYLKLGGMNHILLPDGGAGDVTQVIFGLHAMELLINDLLRKGATRQTMQAAVCRMSASAILLSPAVFFMMKDIRSWLKIPAVSGAGDYATGQRPAAFRCAI